MVDVTSLGPCVYLCHVISDVHTLLVNLIEDINRKHPLDMKTYLAELPDDLAANLKKQVDIFRR